MNPKVFRYGCMGLLLGVAFWAVSTAQAQQRSYSTSGNNSRNSNRSSSGNRSSSSGNSSRDYNNNTMVGDATITSDSETRRIIVVTDDETAMNISQVVSNLDRPKPQVLIKVVFLEVTHNDALDLGIEGSYKKVDGGMTNILSTAMSPTGLAALGASGNPVGAGLYQVLGKDFSATLRAIASAGKTEVLSKPSILVRNNQPATITVGQSVPFITGTRYDAVNGQINTITYEDIGIILRVTPFITADGLVQMMVAPEISSLTDEYMPISKDVNARVISKRSADTVVVTPDRQTVVIGGLMSNQKVRNDTKVPLLGDIPYLGALFRRRQTADAKTELLIFLTPVVVHAPSELASVSEKEENNSDMATKAFSEKELDKFLEGVPLKKAEPITTDKKK